jgi:hypothetical protein
MRPPSSWRLAQTTIPIVHCPFERIPKQAELLNLRLNILYFAFGEFCHPLTRCTARIPYIQNLSEFSQRESGVERITNQSHPPD